MVNKYKSFLKWAGGKYSSLDHIIPFFSGGERFIEPFVGSGTVFLNLNYSSFLLADSNHDLIKLCRYVQSEGDDFIKYCASFFTYEHNTKEYYNHARDIFRNCADERLSSALFLYLNRHGYKGVCRYSLKSGYNVPFGHYKEVSFPHAELLTFQHKSQKADFIHADFRATFAMAKPGDVIYCDPPYVPLSSQKTNFTTFTGIKFEEEDQIALATYAKNAAEQGIPVFISNHDTEVTRALYCHAEIKSFSIKRRVGVGRVTHNNAQELLAIFHAAK